MEFALEMIVKASIHHLRITEVPTRLSVDGRGPPPHLRSRRDGWRSLRLFLLLSPRATFLYPGAAVFLFGLLATLILFTGDIAVGQIGFAEHTMVMTAAAINIGFESMLFWAFAKMIATQSGLLLRDPLFEKLRRAMPLERGLALGRMYAAARPDHLRSRTGRLVQCRLRSPDQRQRDPLRYRKLHDTGAWSADPLRLVLSTPSRLPRDV